MKAILDTNTLVSGLIWHGKPEIIIEKAILQEIQLFASEIILQEYFRILEKLLKHDLELINKWKMLLLDILHIVTPTEKFQIVETRRTICFLNVQLNVTQKLL